MQSSDAYGAILRPERPGDAGPLLLLTLVLLAALQVALYYGVHIALPACIPLLLARFGGRRGRSYPAQPALSSVSINRSGQWRGTVAGHRLPLELRRGSFLLPHFGLLIFRASAARSELYIVRRDRHSAGDWRRLAVLWRLAPWSGDR